MLIFKENLLNILPCAYTHSLSDPHDNDKPLHYDFLMVVLKERDDLVNKVHDLSTQLTQVKVQLGTAGVCMYVCVCVCVCV